MNPGQNSSHPVDPKWQVYHRLQHADVPSDLLCWLLDSASLTQRLICACDGKFEVEVVQQGWQRPLKNESRVLGMRSETYALVRQVRLLCDGEPWVFARTVIPHKTLKGPVRRLAYLGNKPLGAVLFADPTMHRDPIQIACLTERNHHFDLATGPLKSKPEKIWGRRSVFYLSEKPLLVSEIFLPAIRSCNSL